MKKNNKNLILAIIIILGMISSGFFFILRKTGNVPFENDLNGKSQSVENSASFISQGNNDMKIKLKFKAREGVARSIVRYYISLYKADSKGKSIGFSPIDITRYEDKVVLTDKNVEVEREVIYRAPDYLVGKYNLVAEYVNEAGVSRDSINLGSIDLNGSRSNFMEISPESCYLRITGEADSKKYNLMQGVDVLPKEELLINCSIASHFTKSVSVTPQFDNFRRKNFYLENDVPQENKSPKAVIFDPNEKKEVSFSIAKALAPQTYDASLALVDENGKEISTKIFIHYVITGESATVRDVILDKDFYMIGSIAKLTILSSGSADNFDDSRNGGSRNDKIIGEVDIINNDGVTCLAESKVIDLTKADVLGTAMYLLIQRDCQKPFVKTIIKGSTGQILGEKTFLKEFE